MSSRSRIRKRTGELSLLTWAGLAAFPVLAALVCLCVGRMWVSPADMIKSLLTRLGGEYEVAVLTEKALWSVRFPRILLALLCGAGLSLSGCSFQSVFVNPLATPDTLGIASGASLGAAVGILLGFGLTGIQICALLCGLLAVALTYLAGFGRGGNTVVLAGIMMGSLFSALLSLVKYVADPESQLPAITYWLMGSLSGKSYETLAVGAPFIVIPAAVLFLLRWKMNLLTLPEDEALALGVNIKALRLITVACATAMTASCVSMCGQVGWIGLLVPHMCRMKLGTNHLSLVPASICVGAGFMVLVDAAARSLSAAEIPISILTALVGAPFFILLMRRNGGWQL